MSFQNLSRFSCFRNRVRCIKQKFYLIKNCFAQDMRLGPLSFHLLCLVCDSNGERESNNNITSSAVPSFMLVR